MNVKGLGMTKFLIIAVLMVALAACTPSLEDSDGEESRTPEVATEVVPTSTPAALATRIPTNTSIPATRSPTQTPRSLPSENFAGVLIIFRQEGGFAGLDITWRIYNDGRIEQDDEFIGELDQNALLLLMDKIDGSGFYDMDLEEPENICCDFFTFTITVLDGDRANSITISEADPTMPPSLDEVIRLVLQMVND